MRYLCLVHIDGARFASLTQKQREDVDRRSLAYDEKLKASGHFVEAAALEPPGKAVLVQVRERKASTTDGPFIETKEQVGGFILIEARDLDEAVHIAGGIPMAEFGTIEVRPVFAVPVPP